MRTNEIFLTILLAAAVLESCTHREEPATADGGEVIRISADIGETTRAVIDAGYAGELEVSFARFDNPASGGREWNTTAVDAFRSGGNGNTSITFNPEQVYLSGNRQSALIGYYPRKAPEGVTTDPVSVNYTITGDDDIMATEVQTGALNAKFTPFTFQHLLTQLQFKCIGSDEAMAKWTAVSSLTVKNIPTALKLSLDKTGGAILTATGAVDQQLAVKNCPAVVSAAGAENPQTGYLLLFPAAELGTEMNPVTLEVKAIYNGIEKTLDVTVGNIDGGVQVGESHLITLTFAEDSQITAEAGIAEWLPGNAGTTVVIPGE